MREIPVDGKSSISTLSPVSDSIRERKTERKKTLCGTKSMYRIFIVEDDQIIARTVKRHLEKWNYTVHCVENFNDVMAVSMGGRF